MLLDIADPRIEVLLHRMPLPIAAVDRGGNVVFMNLRAVEWSGYTPQNTPTLTEWRRKAFPDDAYRARVTQQWDLATADAERNGTAIEPRELRVVIANGDCRSVTVCGIPMQGGFLATFVDTTEQLRHEQFALEAQKREAVTALAGGVAHEFNNLLAILMAHLDAAQRGAERGEDVQQHVSTMRSVVLVARDLVRDLLAFATQKPSAPVAVDVGAAVQRAAQLLQPLVPTGAVLHSPIHERVPRIMADESLLTQMLLNIGVNAIDAMNGRNGSILIEVRSQPGTKSAPPRVVVSVRDEGIGMSEAERLRCIEPFFTTKAAGSGTGLGLAVVDSIARSYGGTITIHSEPGRGTQVDVSFPAEAGSGSS